MFDKLLNVSWKSEFMPNNFSKHKQPRDNSMLYKILLVICIINSTLPFLWWDDEIDRDNDKYR